MADHLAVPLTRVTAAVCAAAALTFAPVGVASAHNHLFNPSGACNANGGPGNADAAVNPGGHIPGNRQDVASGNNANAHAQAPAHCANS